VSCRWIRHQLSPYLDGMLEERTATRVKHHLEVCAACAWELRALQRGVGLIRGLERHTPPIDSWQSILANIPDRLTQQSRHGWLRPALAGAFTTALIAVILFATLPHRNSSGRYANGGGGAKSTEANTPGSGLLAHQLRVARLPLPAPFFDAFPADPAMISHTDWVQLSSRGLAQARALLATHRETVIPGLTACEPDQLPTPAAPAPEDSGDFRPAELRGLAVDSLAVGHTASVESILKCMKERRLNLLAVDFGWMTFYWPRTDFRAITRLIEGVRKAGAHVWALYHPERIGLSDRPYLPAQILADEAVDDQRLCFTQLETRAWVAAWAKQIASRCPSLKAVVIIDPGFAQSACQCALCRQRFRRETGASIADSPLEWSRWKAHVIEQLVEETALALHSEHPEIKLGVAFQAEDEQARPAGQNRWYLSQAADFTCPLLTAGAACPPADQLPPQSPFVAFIRLPLQASASSYQSAAATVLTAACQGRGFVLLGYDPFARSEDQALREAMQRLTPAQ